jgi:Rrf2 family protein
MPTILRISDAAAIAVHAADYLANKEGLSTAQEISRALDVSYNHLSKVLQQLTRAGLISPSRGPKGGFTLSAAGLRAPLKEFVKATDGPPAGRTGCVFGAFLRDTNRALAKVLEMNLKDMSRKGSTARYASAKREAKK